MTIKIDLAGPSGNAWALLGIAKTWSKELGWDRDKLAAVHADMTAGDYHALLGAFEKAFGGIVGFEFRNDPRRGRDDDR